MLAGGINLDPGPVRTSTFGMTSFFATAIFLLTELNNNLILIVITQKVVISGVYLKLRECILLM